MSQERRRAREAREAAAAQQAAQTAAAQTAAAQTAAAQARRPGRSNGRTSAAQASKGAATARRTPRSARQTVYRQRRFPPLPWRLKLALGLGWLTAVLLGAYLVPTWLGRLGVAVVATFCLPLIVVIVRDPTRRTSR